MPLTLWCGFPRLGERRVMTLLRLRRIAIAFATFRKKIADSLGASALVDAIRPKGHTRVCAERPTHVLGEQLRKRRPHGS